MAETTLPFDEKLERSIIAACLLEKDAVPVAVGLLKPEQFYIERNALVFEAICNLAKRNQSPDTLSVIHELKSTGKDRAFESLVYDVSKLTDSYVASANLEFHAALIRQKWLIREAFRLANQIHGKCFEPSTDGFELTEGAIKSFSDLLAGIESNTVFQVGQLLDQVLEDCKAAINTQKVGSIPIRIRELQMLCGGFRKKRVIIVAARPGMGKTAVALDYAVYAAQFGFPVAIFSQEMAGTELAERLYSAATGINAMKISNRHLNADEVAYMEQKRDHHGLPLYVDDTPGLTLQQIRNRTIRMKRKQNIELLIVDYLQLCEAEPGERDNREQVISKISRGLKKLAKELDIPVIALSQLNRQNEGRADNKPKLSDLRESGAIEQDADMVILLHRPEYYGINEYEIDRRTISSSGLLVKIIAKNRGGVTGEIECRWKGDTMEILNPREFQPTNEF